MARIFISYRRDDSAGEAGRLRDRLAERFGDDQLFMDVEALGPGTDFPAAIERALDRCRLCLVVIGRRWLEPGERRRLEDPGDFVHLEVASVLRRGIPVIPVLVQGARMPKAADLPQALAPLAARQAVSLDHEEFLADARRLIDSIERLPGLRERWPARGAKRRLALLGLGTLLLVVAVETARRLSAPASEVRPPEAPPRPAWIDETLAVAAQQRGRRQYAEAWQTLESGGPELEGDALARVAWEDLALDWLENIRVSEGQRFTDIALKLEPVLDRGSLGATPQRRADLLAHLGWASFMRWRDGDPSQEPERLYRQALELDAGNVYAHAMLGHWLLWNRPIDLSGAEDHFERALAGGREAAYARSLQLSALFNANDDAANLEIVRAADEMRRSAQAFPQELVYDVWRIYAWACQPLSRSDGEEVQTTLLAALPAPEHLATFRWLFGAAEVFERIDGPERAYVLGLLEEACGEREQALQSLRFVAEELAARGISSGTAFERTSAALARLTVSR